MNSSSDRRVLDGLDPESSQTTRDEQLINHRPQVKLLGAHASNFQSASAPGWRLPWPPITTQFILSDPSAAAGDSQAYAWGSDNDSETNDRLVQLRPPRLTFRFQTQPGPHTILSDIPQHRRNLINRSDELKGWSLFNLSGRHHGSERMFQEKTTRQWQKN